MLTTIFQELFVFSFTMLSLAFVLFVVENLRPIQRGLSFDTEKRTELILALINNVFIKPLSHVIFILLTVHVLEAWVPYQIFSQQILALPLWTQVLLGLLIMDFSTYVRHRFMHTYLWDVHAVHHSAHHVTWLTAFRLHPVEMFLATIFDFTALYILGFEGQGIIIAGIVMYALNVFTHSNLNLSWPGPLRYVLGSPCFHRWHHAKYERVAFGKNYTVVFPFIDWIFGSYYYPVGKLPSDYGFLQAKDEAPIGLDFRSQITYPFLKPKKSGE